LHGHRRGRQLRRDWRGRPGQGCAIVLRQLLSHFARLDQLSRRLGKEIVRWWKRDDPLLYLERRELLAALDRTSSGIDKARVALAKACRRLRGG
jgi:hypothetical protein